MKNENNIEKIFQDGFENYQPEVNPDLWNSIESQIQSGGNTPPPSDGGSTSIVQTIVKSTQFWVATTIITVAVVSTIVVVNNLKENQNDRQETSSAQSHNIDNKNTKHTTPQQDSHEEPGDLDQPVVQDTDNNTIVTSDSPGSTTPVEQTNENDDAASSNVEPKNTSSSENPDSAENEVSKDQKAEKTQQDNTKSSENAETTPPAKPIDIDRMIVSSVDQFSTGTEATFKLDNSSEIENINWYLNGKLIVSSSSTKIQFDEEGRQLLEAEVTFTNGEEMVYDQVVTVKACSYLGQFEPGSMKKGLGKIPNTFSPNRDGKNDFFSIDSRNISSFNIIIFDSKGQMVFGSEKATFRWDGTDRAGKPLDENQFRYSIRAVGKDGQRYQTEGQLIIYR